MKEIRHLKTIKNKRNLNTKWLLLQNDQNADTTLLHSHDGMVFNVTALYWLIAVFNIANGRGGFIWTKRVICFLILALLREGEGVRVLWGTLDLFFFFFFYIHKSFHQVQVYKLYPTWRTNIMTQCVFTMHASASVLSRAYFPANSKIAGFPPWAT